METLLPNLLIGLGLLAGIAYFVMCHAIATIARKTDQNESAEILAYVPLLQIAPMIWVGGGSVRRFLIFGASLLLANLLLGFAAGQIDGPLAAAMAIFASFSLAIASCVYMTVLACRTASARELPGWFGLLTWLPGISFFVYPIIAFHDGWARPHRVGGFIGIVVVLATLAPSVFLANHLEESGGIPDLAGWNQTEEFGDLASTLFSQAGPDDAAQNIDPSAENRPLPSANLNRAIPVLFDLKERFEYLRALDQRARDQGDAASSLEALATTEALRRDLAAHQADVDPETYQQLMTQLIELEADLTERSEFTGTIRIARTESERVRPGNHAPPASLGHGKASQRPAPLRPFPVEIDEACPAGSELRSRNADRGDEEWCQQTTAAGGLRHGWYARYFDGGQPEQVGEYRDGLRIGTWTRFYPSGAVRAQAQFESGLQEGWMLSFDESGTRQTAVRFAHGAPVR